MAGEWQVRKFTCDRCGSDVVNTHGRLNLSVEHLTNQGEEVGEDRYAGIDLCYGCIQYLIKLFRLRIHIEEDDYPRDIREEIVPRRPAAAYGAGDSRGALPEAEQVGDPDASAEPAVKEEDPSRDGPGEEAPGGLTPGGSCRERVVKDGTGWGRVPLGDAFGSQQAVLDDTAPITQVQQVRDDRPAWWQRAVENHAARSGLAVRHD